MGRGGKEEERGERGEEKRGERGEEEEERESGRNSNIYSKFIVRKVSKVMLKMQVSKQNKSKSNPGQPPFSHIVIPASTGLLPSNALGQPL